MSKKILWFLVAALSLFSLGTFFFALLAFSLAFEEVPGLEKGNGIAYIEVKGPILDSKEIVSHLEAVRRNKKIRALLLRIDSPGGGVGASQEIYEAVLKVREKKKVVASMGGVAASGGYYIAIAADKIVANPGTVTGSIGVLMDHANFSELLQFLKIDANILTAGQNKDVGSPIRALSEKDRQLIQSVLDDLHDQFKAAIKKQRKLNQTELDALADGRIFTGRQAKKLKLVDELGNQQFAFELLKHLSGIKGEVEIIEAKKKATNVLDLLFSSDLQVDMTRLFYSARENRFLYISRGLTR